ncbi:MAG: 50S ribosomal protein L19 [Alphaproteobacteria bacterium]
MNFLESIEKREIENLTKGKSIPKFRAGDTVCVNVKIVEGTRERIQAFQGAVMARKSRGMGSSFRIQKISYGESVERVFQLYSPNISVDIVRYGRVRRAKLYYLRGRRGKSARITEKFFSNTKKS